jgi:hypothetical protein
MGAADETRAAFHELIDAVGDLDARFGEVGDPQSVLEGYKWAPSLLQVAMQVYVFADTARPRFVDIVGPTMKWGGDNADAFYQYAPIDPSRSYRVRGRRGDAVYLSLTVYGGPNDGHYSDRIVGAINDRMLTFDDAGRFELALGPEPPPDRVAWIKLDGDAVCAITRDYLADPFTERRAEWKIEALDPPPTWREHDGDLAQRFRAAITWIKEQAEIAPLALGEPNVVDAPYPVPTATFGWAAGDAAYAMGSFDLSDEEALVIEGRSPECAFWNLCLWNQFLHTFNYDYERVTINGSQVSYNADGSWTIVVAGRDPGHANWVSTAGHERGRLWFRWFLPACTPDRPTTRVVAISDLTAIAGVAAQPAPGASTSTSKRLT